MSDNNEDNDNEDTNKKRTLYQDIFGTESLNNDQKSEKDIQNDRPRRKSTIIDNKLRRKSTIINLNQPAGPKRMFELSKLLGDL